MILFLMKNNDLNIQVFCGRIMLCICCFRPSVDTICSVLKNLCSSLFALLYRLVGYLHCCTYLLFIFAALPTYLFCWTNVLCLCCFSPFQLVFLFLIRMCVALFINCKFCFILPWSTNAPNLNRGLRGRDPIIVWLITSCAISDYHH
jgi:hypothetical protein